MLGRESGGNVQTDRGADPRLPPAAACVQADAAANSALLRTYATTQVREEAGKYTVLAT